MKLSATTELIALAAAVLVAAACVIGLGAVTAAWVGWGLGLALSAAAALHLGRRALDERSIRREQVQHAPEPPARPTGQQY